MNKKWLTLVNMGQGDALRRGIWQDATWGVITKRNLEAQVLCPSEIRIQIS